MVLALEHAIDGKTLALKPADGNDRRDAASQPQQMWPQQQLQPQQLMQPQQMHPPQMQMQPMQSEQMQPQLPESQMHMLQQMQWQQMQQLQAQQLQLQPPNELQLQPQLQPQQLQPRYEGGAVRGGPGGRYAIPTKHKIFVGGLPDVGDDALVAYFSQFGAVADAIAMRKDGKPRGFGFVTFSSPEVYQQVLAQEHAIDGKTLALKPADGNDRRDAASPAARSDLRFHPYGQARPLLTPYAQPQQMPQYPQLDLMQGQHLQLQQLPQHLQQLPPQELHPQQMQPQPVAAPYREVFGSSTAARAACTAS